MTEFKLKINIGNASIELEGDGVLVKEIFKDLKETGLGNLSENIRPLKKECLPISNDVIEQNDFSDNESCEVAENFPPIKDLILQGKLSNEQDKLFVIAFYLSNFGRDVVIEDSIRDKFKEMNLWTKTASGNFKTNLKKLIGDKKVLSSYGETSYSITQCGQEYAKTLIFGESVKSESRKNKTTKNVNIKYELVDLSLNEEDKKNIIDLFSNKEDLNNLEKVVLAANWYKTQKNNNTVNKDIVYSILKNANVSTAFSIKDALNNAKNKNYFWKGQDKGEFQISHIGEEVISKILTEVSQG